MGVKELWKLFREEKLMQEWSCETHGAGVQKAVADQIEGDWVEFMPAFRSCPPKQLVACPAFCAPWAFMGIHGHNPRPGMPMNTGKARSGSMPVCIRMC